MSKLHQIAGALMTTVGLHGAAMATGAVPAPLPPSSNQTVISAVNGQMQTNANKDLGTHSTTLTEVNSASPAQLVLTCKTQGMWKSIPSEDFSAMGQLGKSLCTDQDFQTALPIAGATRDKYFTQLSLAHRQLAQLAQLGRAVQGGDLTDINLPNMFVVEKPNASAKGGIVYQFELTIRQPLSEGGTPLSEEQNDGTTRTGKLKGLLEVAPAAKALARSTLQ